MQSTGLWASTKSTYLKQGQDLYPQVLVQQLLGVLKFSLSTYGGHCALPCPLCLPFVCMFHEKNHLESPRCCHHPFCGHRYVKPSCSILILLGPPVLGQIRQYQILERGGEIMLLDADQFHQHLLPSNLYGVLKAPRRHPRATKPFHSTL